MPVVRDGAGVGAGEGAGLLAPPPPHAVKVSATIIVPMDAILELFMRLALTGA
jgi:hypothetical protein